MKKAVMSALREEKKKKRAEAKWLDVRNLGTLDEALRPLGHQRQ